MAISFTNLTANVNNIQSLSDKPNETDGLTAQGLKEKFDKAGVDIKSFINNTHIPELKVELKKIDDASIKTTDSRLSNSRTCNNNFDTPLTARENLRIKYGTTLPDSGNTGDIFFLYKE